MKSGWKFTALKVAKAKTAEATPTVNTSALRMTFLTEQPLFPYREPKSTEAAAALSATTRMLLIYFIADARFKGQYPDEKPWKANVAWSNSLSAERRTKLLESLKLPESTGPANWHLTEFEHEWPYADARGDVYFVRDADQKPVKREPWIVYVRSNGGGGDAAVGCLALALLVPYLARRLRRQPRLAT